MTVINIEEKQGTWFEMEGGGRVQLRTLTADDLKAIRKATVKKRVEFKKVDGTPGRFEVEETDEEKQSEMFWDRVIVSWENLFDGKGEAIPCTKENKMLLIMRSLKFSKFVGESLKVLQEQEAELEEAREKN
ncbi:MAG: hypothetical protein PHG80_11995 [Methanoregulaceae archaeon]|nr:hypothetical protein [Methanoregulaceae archaeon]